MKSLKYFLSAIIVTTVVLAYTWQQIELVKVSYEIKNLREQAVTLLDQNRFLRYNVANLRSPERLARYVACQNPNLTEPVKLWEIKQVKPVKVTSQIIEKSPLLSFFIPTAEASASAAAFSLR
ncbi:MAG: hypothetical protein U9Q08_04715 [Candidatus Omnitrophota bacterium]|nr:hypothetical protein [Candidatus Omnitrophota bacterium]